MTLEEFIVKTKQLEDYYAKDFNTVQREFWYSELKNYDAGKYEKAIKHLCKTSRNRPLLSEVIEAIRQIRLVNDIERKIIPCELCKGTGYILYTKKEGTKSYQYACLCVCQNAEGLEYNGLEIADKEHRQPFYISRAQDIFGDKLNMKMKKETNIKQRDVKNLIANLGKQMSL